MPLPALLEHDALLLPLQPLPPSGYMFRKAMHACMAYGASHITKAYPLLLPLAPIPTHLSGLRAPPTQEGPQTLEP